MKVLSYKVPTQEGTYSNHSYLIDESDIDYDRIPNNIKSYAKAINNDVSVAVLSIWDKTKPFKEFDIPKRKEGYRHIKAPVGVYKYAQAYAMRYLRDKLRITESQYAYGFVRRKSCYGAVSEHHKNESNWFLKLDIADFFPCISAELIRTAIKDNVNGTLLNDEAIDALVYTFTDETGHLTQGCISSPYIANIVLSKFDCIIGEYCARNKIIYTRYADDMCFSSKYDFDFSAVIKRVRAELPSGLNIKDTKTKYGSKAGVNVILGIHYNAQGNLTVGHQAKHNMKLVAHNWSKLSWEERGHYIGLKTYYKTIEPEYFSNPRFDIISWENR